MEWCHVLGMFAPIVISWTIGFVLDTKYEVQRPVLYWFLGGLGVMPAFFIALVLV